ncbi:MAG: hypothetical protein Q8K33_01495 [Cypionkella sp.]|uniref:hypothetical protein n=1 Tax=Cypionkella sp. TaxID=2811411 RepID=UPI00272EF7AC|nr:hypothetical protein [Cypionkella sp.]MDP2047555.1 hypothetical protein [Cypionkella sp.]
MSVAGLAGFIQGFADQRQDQKDRAERAANGARQDRMIDAMGAMPGGMPSGGGMGAIPDGGGGTGTAGPAQASGNGLFGLIDKTEGGGNYSTLFGNAQNGGRFDGVDVSQMTLDQLYDFSNPSGEYGQWVKGANPRGVVATPMGRHQIVGTTLRNAANEMKLPGSTKFTPGTQDAIAGHLAHRRLAGAQSPAAKRAAMRAEWDGFRNVSDAALDGAIAQFESSYGQVPPRPMGATGPM